MKPFQASMSSLTTTTAATPLHYSINMWAWNAADRMGVASRVGIHPSRGLSSWDAVVAVLHEACGAGVSGDAVVFTSAGVPMRDYRSFLKAFAAEKEVHAARWATLSSTVEARQKDFTGPQAPITVRPEEDAIDRVFHFDVVCAEKGCAFRVPAALQKKLQKRAELDALQGQVVSAPSRNDSRGAAQRQDTDMSTSVRSGELRATPSHVILGRRLGDGILVRSGLQNSTNGESSRDDLKREETVAPSPTFLLPSESSAIAASVVSTDDVLSPSRMRRLSTLTTVLQTTNILEKAMSMRRTLIQSLRKGDDGQTIPQGGEEMPPQGDAFQRAAEASRRRSSTAPLPPDQGGGSGLRRVSFAAKIKALNQPMLTEATTNSSSPTSTASSPQGRNERSPDSAGSSPNSPMRTSHGRLTDSIPFPLGVVRNRQGEYVKIDGGALYPGSVATSTATGELYKVEWMDWAHNTAHCRWIVRACDPFLSHFVQTSENSFLQRLSLSEHFQKYYFHWMERMDVANRQVERVVGEETTTNGGAKRTVRAAGIDDSMLLYGVLPDDVDENEAFSSQLHQLSPVVQKRLQRHGGQTPFGVSHSDEEDSSSDDSDGSSDELSPRASKNHEGEGMDGLTDVEVATIKDFEALFPLKVKRKKATTDAERASLVGECIRREMPKVVVSKNVCFLTDVCVSIRLNLLKPTTTFRFLLWIDLAFVIALRNLLRVYPTITDANNKERGEGGPPPELLEPQLPIDDVTPAARPLYSDLFRFCRSGALKVQSTGNGKREFVESCFSHERSTAGVLLLDPFIEETTACKDEDLIECVACNARSIGSQRQQRPEESREITFVM